MLPINIVTGRHCPDLGLMLLGNSNILLTKKTVSRCRQDKEMFIGVPSFVGMIALFL